VDSDAKGALELVAELAADGVDLRRFVAEAIGFFRGVFLAHYAPNLAEIADEPSDVIESWKKAATQLPSSDVLRALDLLAEALVRLREGREERLMAELALLKLTRPETASDAEALISRMDRLERRMAHNVEHVPARVAEPPNVDEAQAEEPVGIDISLEQLKNVWPGLFGGLSEVLGARRWALFREATPAEVHGRTIILEVSHDFHLTALEQDEVVGRIVATKAGDLLGGPVKVVFRARGRHDEKIDLDQLEERPETSPEVLLATELGARIVDE
jgi:DNA polymerase-3 subunit gamma/tau